VNAVNAVDLESYVRGVVPKESPASWPPEALKAQAVAARSYAIADALHGAGYDQFDDSRSQVYGGVGAEAAKSNQAVDATAGQVVMYAGKIAQTFFFSTSGGHTENNEFSSLGFGQPAIPYLRGVDDPYEAEAGSAYEHWKRKFTAARMRSALSGLGLKGRLRKVAVKQRGSSPRIVRAKLVGSGGVTAVTGPQLASALGLPDTWAFFKKK
jgi:stage II sporulation protein D